MRLLEARGGRDGIRSCGRRRIQGAAAAQRAPRARQRLRRPPQRACQSSPHALASESSAADAEQSSALGCKSGGRGEGGCTREREKSDDDRDSDGDGELGAGGELPADDVCLALTSARIVLARGLAAASLRLPNRAPCWQNCYFVSDLASGRPSASGMDFGDVVAARVTTQPEKKDVADIWRAAAADALAAEPPPPKTGWDSTLMGQKQTSKRSKRTDQVHRFGSFRTYFRMHGSAIFHKMVVSRSLVAAAMAESAYYANMCGTSVWNLFRAAAAHPF